MHRAGFWIRTLAAVIDLVAFLPLYIVAIIAMTAISQRVGNADGQMDRLLIDRRTVAHLFDL
jgi:hypothetical protein